MTLTNIRRLSVPLLAGLVAVTAACGDDDPDSSVTLSEPADGAVVHGAVQLSMTADGITIEEAGEERENAGHFHVLADAGCLDPGTAIGKDADHVHFGGGQSAGVIYLGPGGTSCVSRSATASTKLLASPTRRARVRGRRRHRVSARAPRRVDGVRGERVAGVHHR